MSLQELRVHAEVLKDLLVHGLAEVFHVSRLAAVQLGLALGLRVQSRVGLGASVLLLGSVEGLLHSI